MLERWFDDVEDGASYLESFNSPSAGLRGGKRGSGLVRGLSGRLGSFSAMPVSQAAWAASAMTLPWLIAAWRCESLSGPSFKDFIPWWATSELTGWEWLAWLLGPSIGLEAHVAQVLPRLFALVLRWPHVFHGDAGLRLAVAPWHNCRVCDTPFLQGFKWDRLFHRLTFGSQFQVFRVASPTAELAETF